MPAPLTLWAETVPPEDGDFAAVDFRRILFADLATVAYIVNHRTAADAAPLVLWAETEPPEIVISPPL